MSGFQFKKNSLDPSLGHLAGVHVAIKQSDNDGGNTSDKGSSAGRDHAASGDPLSTGRPGDKI